MTAQKLQDIKSKINYLQDDKNYHSQVVLNISRQIELLKKEIGPHCDHTSCQPFQWLHDNGYGKQTTSTGIRCLHCGKENAWGRPEGLWDYPD